MASKGGLSIPTSLNIASRHLPRCGRVSRPAHSATLPLYPNLVSATLFDDNTGIESPTSVESPIHECPSFAPVDQIEPPRFSRRPPRVRHVLDHGRGGVRLGGGPLSGHPVRRQCVDAADRPAYGACRLGRTRCLGPDLPDVRLRLRGDDAVCPDRQGRTRGEQVGAPLASPLADARADGPGGVGQLLSTGFCGYAAVQRAGSDRRGLLHRRRHRPEPRRPRAIRVARRDPPRVLGRRLVDSHPGDRAGTVHTGRMSAGVH